MTQRLPHNLYGPSTAQTAAPFAAAGEYKNTLIATIPVAHKKFFKLPAMEVLSGMAARTVQVKIPMTAAVHISEGLFTKFIPDWLRAASMELATGTQPMLSYSADKAVTLVLVLKHTLASK